MNQSRALFLLVGTELVKAQNQPDYDWKYTQNWIAYEIGLACKSNIDVWVLCDQIEINFPVPYLNNYAIHGINLENEISRNWIYSILDGYKRNQKYRLNAHPEYNLECPGCGSIYNFYSTITEWGVIHCPTCLGEIEFPKGWLLYSRDP